MNNVYSVGQVNRYVKNMFTQDYFLQNIYVKGEVSNCKYHSTGHIYFTLKDEGGTLKCVMFAGSRRGLAFRMKDGDKVIAGGRVDVYERDGVYQFYAKEITLEGAGALYERYLALKQELEDMGMFAQEYKQPIPEFAHRVGIVTSPTGAAIRDIINVSTRRNPFIQSILYPALVQGEGAAASIVRGIRMLDEAGVDVIIVGRGGGSIEELWAFNEEEVARAIFECHTPVISAVGHETDFTIADFVADLRAPTPSAAAELAYFGAKILHPSSIQPAKKANIPVRMKNTMNPSDEGTLITKESPIQDFKAVAAKDGITAIKVKSSNMLLAYGFVRKVFEIFENYQTPIDMVTTSEVGVSVTIDNTEYLQEIVARLESYATVFVEKEMVIICVVGDLEWRNVGFEALIIEALKDIPVRMISYGGSSSNVSLVMRKEDKTRALQALSTHLFDSSQSLPPAI